MKRRGKSPEGMRSNASRSGLKISKGWGYLSFVSSFMESTAVLLRGSGP